MLRILVCVAALVAAPALGFAQGERMTPAPWKMLTGKDAGAAATCIENDPEEGCLIVRCNPQRGLELVMREGLPWEPTPPSFEFQIGSWRIMLPFSRVTENELATSLAEQDELLRRFASTREPLVYVFTKGIEKGYSTAFDLKNAGRLITRLRDSCRR
jgi:hypothetical protein